MNFIKKILCGVVAASVLAANYAIMTSAATTYDPCDVDHNGLVDLSDLVIVNKYLAGAYYFPNYNQLDVNRSLTVDSSDSLKITAYMLGNTYSYSYISRENSYPMIHPTINGATLNSDAGSTAIRTYSRYSYVTHQQLDDYDLTPSTPLRASNRLDNTRDVIGDEDSRYPSCSEENSGIVLLEGIGTGFIVGDHEIATAAHCVYKKNGNNGYWRSSITIKTYDSNGFPTSTSLTPIEAHLPTQYRDCVITNATPHNQYIPYDYAVITVSENLSGYVHFSLGTAYNAKQTDYNRIPIFVTGCPGESNGHVNINDRLYSSEGRVVGNNNTLILHYNADTSNGDSGAPVYTITQNRIGTDTSYTYTALCIHSYGFSELGYNCGSLITKYHLQFYNYIKNLDRILFND